MKPNDGGPAFPLTEDAVNHKNREFAMQGMSLRDWFAGQAMAALMASMITKLGAGGWLQSGIPTAEWPTTLALRAYDQADAMIAERQKEAES